MLSVDLLRTLLHCPQIHIKLDQTRIGVAEEDLRQFLRVCTLEMLRHRRRIRNKFLQRHRLHFPNHHDAIGAHDGCREIAIRRKKSDNDFRDFFSLLLIPNLHFEKFIDTVRRLFKSQLSCTIFTFSALHLCYLRWEHIKQLK